LADHKAGFPIFAEFNKLFRRQTDRVVREALRKSPLEVGADRIARTAVAALSLLADLGVLIGKNIALAWEARLEEGIRAIEVYPAGTLRAYQLVGVASSSMSSDQAKQGLVAKLKKKGRIRFDRRSSKAIDNEHVLDSVLCALAAMDIAEQRVIFPATDRERDLARKEGWIWERDPAAK
jgi:hypothetical protein